MSMKILIFIIIVLLIFGTFVYSYYTDENEFIKRNYNKFLNKPCELKQLSDGWTQIENCAVYRIKRGER